MTVPSTSPPTLDTKGQVAQRLQISIRQVDRLVAAGKLPPPIRVGKRAARWRTDEITAFINRIEK